MDLYMITLRLIHILAGVFWVGSGVIFVGFFLPVLRTAGPAGDKIMHGLGRARLAPALATSAILTVVAGLLMYWRTSAGLNTGWITSSPGLALTVGGLAGILALLSGARFTGPDLDRRIELAREIEAEGGAATAEQQAEIEALHDHLDRFLRYELALMVVAVIGMATFRYLRF